MKKLIPTIPTRIFCTLIASVFAVACIPAFATTTTFTTNSAIGSSNTNYDGTDIVITNCTLTVDGLHDFSSLRVAAGGVLTHTFSPSGSVSNLLYITNELQVLSGTNPVTLLNSNVITTTVSVTDTNGTNFYVNGGDYLLTSPDGIVTDLERTTNSTIPDGATVLVSYETLLGTASAGLNLSITGNVEIDAGGAINANGTGYANGPGAGLGSGSGAGGSFGGNGGASSSGANGGNPYGSFIQPANLGSGGGSGSGGAGGAGGGLIEIAAGGNVIVNGLITANGANGTNDRSGGGSGGGIWISGVSLSGAGMITANGGAGDPTNGGGGGGGRISLQYNSTSFTGSMVAFGGTGSGSGSAGTVYRKLSGQNGLVVLDNGGKQSQTNTALAIQNSSLNVTIQNNASVQPLGAWLVGNLTVASNGLLVASPLTTLALSSAGVITIEAGGGILGNGAGSAPGAGAGAGHSYNDGLYRPCGGGGYGGYGASSPLSPSGQSVGGTAYGNQSFPSGFGSGGGSLTGYSIGGAGGGGIQITCQGGIVQVDGTISANGGNGSGSGGGGGSGGTITLTGGTLLGSGSITVAGGTGANSIGGGGGGGRVFLNPTANLFSGNISANGGGGGGWGGAGIVIIQVPGQNAQLVLDNGGNPGTNTPVQSASATDLIVRGGAIGSASTSVSFANLYVNSNGWLAPVYIQPPAAAVNFSFTGNATVQAGGGIIANFAGYAGGNGNGSGHFFQIGSTNLCSGAGHGGYGGNSSGNDAGGGSTYDSPTAPNIAGSGGGAASPLSLGGTGGGIIRLTVTGTLEVDGVISANGGNGSGSAGGGGSGGSIWLAVGTISGAGSITANGGAGVNALGGGGGGGMIYIPCNNNAFSGTLTAYGGGGANWGGAGTSIIMVSGKNSQLIVDAGGNPGARTPLPNSSLIDVTLRNGAVGLVNGTLSVGNLLISSNASLLVSNYNSYAITCSSLTLQPGGEITADSQGYPGGEGPNLGRSYGNSPYYPCGGGGNGGIGGSGNSTLAVGGGAAQYGLNAGSGGGSYSTLSVGGDGGGIISITTTGLLQLDGIISANGGNGSGIGGGGGAGGGIALTAGSLGGAGVIRANGGNGAGSIGGGGGGGLISIVVNSTMNQFAGLTSAFGGSGANQGGTGPISIQTAGQGIQLVLDSGGNPGPATPLISSSSTTSLTLRNGAMGSAGSSLNFNNVLISSNSWLVVSNSQVSSTTMTFSSANIQAGGGITADSQGYAAGLGSGAGHGYGVSPNYPCGGAGHGGNGGNGSTNFATGGVPYDNQTSPNTAGSGGGSYSTFSQGGTGGGAFSITVSGLLRVDGIISANGGNGSGIGGGGGSGGSIKLNVTTLAGAGSIRANGGSGVGSIGGGGAGGCIAIFPTVNLFTGAISTGGGGGANPGGSGTVYVQASGQNAQLILDNAGQSGAATQIQSLSSSTALILRNGAVGYPQTTSQTFASLLIGSNAWLMANPNTGQVNLTLTGNATVQAGGGIVADHAGFAPGLGSGAGHPGSLSPYFPCGGGGYGGTGGYGGVEQNNSENLVSGGSVYASVISPASNGSGGGNFAPDSFGGSGGGSIHLTVEGEGTLNVSGSISADGGNGSGLGGGGGSGGSILLNVGTLVGDGAITANGGTGADVLGGGGGGGRISISYNADSFTGLMTAHGGGGYAYGGAGTIYTRANSQSAGQVLVENGGATGNNTPLSSLLGSPSIPFNLTIENGAIVCPQINSSFPLLSSLTIGTGGLLTGLSGPSTLDLLVFNNADVAPGGSIAVDGEGYSQAAGPGAGQSNGGNGSGAGYGGVGGASSTVSGGVSYGSASQPVDFGSGGGFGSQTPEGGSGGGGAIRLNVGGILTVDGQLRAEGEPGLQDNSGGGSGGSIWVTTGALLGEGLVAADGGEGELYGGGGGAGGRIALYSITNDFLGGASASGGGGDFSGANGTILISNNVPGLQVVSNSLSGIVSNGVSSAILYFNAAPNPNSVSSANVSLATPNGLLPSSSISISMLSSATYLVSFPLQTSIGNYGLAAGTNILDLYGRPLAQAYSGTFVISLPAIQGTITDASGNPLAGVLLEPTAGFSSATTDTNGNYNLGFVPGSSFTVTPSLGTFAFVPPSLSYTNVSASISNQNYLAVTTLAPVLSAAVNATNFVLSWQAIPGVNYQVYYSTDLVNWLAYGSAFTGSNGPVQMLIPISGNPQEFFNVQSSN